MAKLTAAARNKLPKSSFGVPGKRSYPMPDRVHAGNAKARAAQARKAGRISASTEARIDAKANRVLGSKSGATANIGRHGGDYSGTPAEDIALKADRLLGKVTK